MSTFKDDLASDLDVFINPDEFGEEHEINGEMLLCVVQSPTDKEVFLTGGKYDGYDGIEGKQTIVHIKKETLPENPPEGGVLTLDGTEYLVNQVVEDMGMLSITLHAYIR